MRRNIMLPLFALIFTLNLATSARAFQGNGGSRTAGGFGFTGSPGGGFTGPRGYGFTDSLGGFYAGDDGVGLNIVQALRRGRAGSAKMSANARGNANRSKTATASNVNRPRTADNGNRLNAKPNADGKRPGIGWTDPYMGYHRAWVRGYWDGHYAGGLGWRRVESPPSGFDDGAGPGGAGVSTALGWGLLPWLYGPMLYHYGYARYSNPYHDASAVVARQPVIYDYSQPINPQTAPPARAVIERSVLIFGTARQAFRRGDYPRALELVDEALKSTPNDPTLHEFRGLALFALNRFEEAAPALYAVLSVEPGWDWATLISLYGEPAQYTQHLKALQAFSTQHSRSAQAHFMLAYHFLTQGYAEAAVRRFKLATMLEPNDTLAAQLLQQLESPRRRIVATGFAQPESTTAATPAARSVASTAPAGKAGKLEATWRAQPRDNTNVALTFDGAGHFTWKVNQQGKQQQFQGRFTNSNGVVTLVEDHNPDTIASRLHWSDGSQFVFKVIGAGPDDPGLSFTKSPAH